MVPEDNAKISQSLTLVLHSVLIVNSVLNVKSLVGTFNQEEALVGAFSVIVKLCVIFGNLRLKL